MSLRTTDILTTHWLGLPVIVTFAATGIIFRFISNNVILLFFSSYLHSENNVNSF